MPHSSVWRQFPRHRRPSLKQAWRCFHSEVVLLQSHRTFLDSLEEDMDRVDVARSPEFVVPVRNRFALLDSTASDTESLISTALDGSGVEADDAPVQIHMEPSRLPPHRRLVLVPQSQGTLGSIPAQSDDVSSRRALRMMQFPVWLAATILRRMSKGCRGTVQLGVADSPIVSHRRWHQFQPFSTRTSCERH